MKNLLLCLLLSICFISCKKEDDIPAENIAQAESLNASLQGNVYMLVSYRSPTPIDYVKDDVEVKAETDLWEYVSPWVKVAELGFQGTTVIVTQGSITLPSDGSATLTRSFNVQADRQGVNMRFLTHDYVELDYRVISFNDAGFVLSAMSNGEVVISEYKKM